MICVDATSPNHDIDDPFIERCLSATWTSLSVGEAAYRAQRSPDRGIGELSSVLEVFVDDPIAELDAELLAGAALQFEHRILGCFRSDDSQRLRLGAGLDVVDFSIRIEEQQVERHESV